MKARVLGRARCAATLLVTAALFAPIPAEATHASLRWPVTGVVISDFGDCRGSNCSRLHQGYDLSARDADGGFDDIGDPVLASYSGVVVRAGRVSPDCGSTGHGIIVEIDHGGGYTTLYSHLSGITVQRNDTVTSSQQIGSEGRTGNACRTVPHVHYEIRRNGKALDVSRNGTGGSCAGAAICRGQRIVAGNPIPHHFEGLASETAGPPPHVAMDAPPGTRGYWLAAEDGGVFTYGSARFAGSMGGQTLAAPVVDMAAHPTGSGYWLAGADGGVFAFGDALYYGGMAGQPLNAPVVGIASTTSGEGYWLAGADGGVFAFGDAIYYGGMAGQPLNQPIVALEATPTGAGYWLVGADGGVFAFGDALYYGGTAGQTLNQPIVDITRTPSGQGYWLVGGDGGVFTFGDAVYHGGMAGRPLNAPVTGMRPTKSGAGYWLIAQDGGVFSFGNAAFYGSNTR